MQQLNLDLSVGPLSIEPKRDVYDLVIKWLDDQPIGKKFNPLDIQRYVEIVTGGKRIPHDGTITRYIRKYNEQGGDILNISRAKSIYMKNGRRKGVYV